MQQKSFRTFEKRARHNTGKSVPNCFRTECGFFYVPHKCEHWTDSCDTRPTVYRSCPRRIEHLTIYKCNYKGSPFYSVIEGPWVLVTGPLCNLPTFDATTRENSGNQRLEKCVRYLCSFITENWDGGQSLKWPGVRDQYPRDITKPAALKQECAFYRIQIPNETTELTDHL